MLRLDKDIAKIMRRHAIEPTVFVLSIDSYGKPNGMAAGWNVKCSYNPPMIAVGLQNGNNTQNLIRESKEFVVAVPSPELKDTLEYFGSVSGKEVDKPEVSKIKLATATIIKTPLVAEARINFECRLVNIIETGDHCLYIGEVVATHYNADKNQLYYAGRDPEGNRVFMDIKTTFLEDV